MPRGMAMAASLMLLGRLLPFLTATAAAYFGALCGALGYWAWVLQGASTLLYLMKKRGAQPAVRALVVALGILVFPPALLLLGCWDQFWDPRRPGSADDDDTI